MQCSARTGRQKGHDGEATMERLGQQWWKGDNDVEMTTVMERQISLSVEKMDEYDDLLKSLEWPVCLHTWSFFFPLRHCRAVVHMMIPVWWLLIILTVNFYMPNPEWRYLILQYSFTVTEKCGSVGWVVKWKIRKVGFPPPFSSGSEVHVTQFGLELYLPHWEMKGGLEPQLKKNGVVYQLIWLCRAPGKANSIFVVLLKVLAVSSLHSYELKCKC